MINLAVLRVCTISISLPRRGGRSGPRGDGRRGLGQVLALGFLSLETISVSAQRQSSTNKRKYPIASLRRWFLVIIAEPSLTLGWRPRRLLRLDGGKRWVLRPSRASYDGAAGRVRNPNHASRRLSRTNGRRVCTGQERHELIQELRGILEQNLDLGMYLRLSRGSLMKEGEKNVIIHSHLAEHAGLSGNSGGSRGTACRCWDRLRNVS
jgi:hypothetical protein